MITGKWSLCAFIPAQEPFDIFSLPCPVVEEIDRAALVGTWHAAKVNPPTPVWKQVWEGKIFVCILLMDLFW